VYFDEAAMVEGATMYTAVAMRHLGLELAAD
jgi:hypothetical protein